MIKTTNIPSVNSKLLENLTIKQLIGFWFFTESWDRQEYTMRCIKANMIKLDHMIEAQGRKAKTEKQIAFYKENRKRMNLVLDQLGLL